MWHLSARRMRANDPLDHADDDRVKDAHPGWQLDHVEPLPGVPLLAHVESCLPESGRGPLPHGGEPLPDEPPKDPSKLRWGGGSLDGIAAVRGARADGNEPLAAAAAVVHLLRKEPTTEAVHAAADSVGAIHGPQQMDRLISAVLADRNLNRPRLRTFARWLCTYGTRREVVKSGIALLGVSGRPDDADLIIRLGLLEELTLYAVVALNNLLADSEEAIFELARQVTGWGRIHAVQRLSGSTNPDVCRWLLRGGAENDVMTEEIAFIAATTGGLREALERDVDEDLLDHAGELLRALAMGGPAEDMSDYGDAADAMRAYIHHMATAVPSLDRLCHLTSLERYLAEWADENPHLDDGVRTDLRARLGAALERPEWAQLVSQKLGSTDIKDVRRTASIAERFGVDAEPTVRAWLARRPHEGYLWQWLLTRADVEHVRELVDRASELLPLSALANGPADDLGLGVEYEADFCLQLIVQRLRDFPGEGWPAVRIALSNRVTGVRNGALRALKLWPEESWPAETRETLTAMLWREPCDDVRRTIRGLLEPSSAGTNATTDE
jgi:hypothetical protein